MIELNYGRIESREILPSDAELSARLGYRASRDDEPIARAVRELLSVTDARYGYALTEAEYTERGVELGFGVIESAALMKNLNRAERVYVFAVTLGLAVDRLIKKKSALSAADGFVYNAVASALAEAAADLAEEKIKTDKACRPRFSPGYADFPLAHQRELLRMLDAEHRIGIALTESLLMIPTKSMTAVFGVTE